MVRAARLIDGDSCTEDIAALGALPSCGPTGDFQKQANDVDDVVLLIDDFAEALRWMSDLMSELGIPYQVVGGLAARCHGATRPLVDVDAYVPDEDALARVAAAAHERVLRAPARHRDEHWDLTFLVLSHGRWTIEMASASDARLWDGRRAEWTPAGIRFEDSETHEVLGVTLPVMPKAQLIAYKEGLDREVDRLDLAELRG